MKRATSLHTYDARLICFKVDHDHDVFLKQANGSEALRCINRVAWAGLTSSGVVYTRPLQEKA